MIDQAARVTTSSLQLPWLLLAQQEEAPLVLFAPALGLSHACLP